MVKNLIQKPNCLPFIAVTQVFFGRFSQFLRPVVVSLDVASNVFLVAASLDAASAVFLLFSVRLGTE